MKKTIFEGAATALITPFDSKGNIDFGKYAELIEYQINGGIDALVVCGTTGESPTLTDEEHKRSISFVIEQANGRVPVIAGTGSNHTDYAISLSKYACECGADGLLVITPYYNKTTQNGLIRMFNEIADSVTKPIIMYNVPSRTGVGFEPSTYVALSSHPNIVGIKEANGNISKIAESIAALDNKLDIYSGNDDQIVPIMSLGGKGVISVLSNLLPGETSKICHLCLEGKYKEAAALQLKYIDLIKDLFCEVNPVPAKAAMAHLGFTENVLRSPLYPMEKQNEEKLVRAMKAAGMVF